MKNVIYILVVILCFGCKEQNKSTEFKPNKEKDTINVNTKVNRKTTKEKAERVVYDFSSIPNDTVYVKGKEILFIHPSKKEFDILKNEQGIYEVDSDFRYYTSKVIDSLKGKYKISTTSKRIIGIIKSNDTVFLDRLTPRAKYSRDPMHYSAILVFNDYFSGYPNVHTDESYYALIEDYFSNIRYEKPIDYKYVISRNGLNIRQFNGTVDGKYNNGDFVKIIGYTDEVIEVEDNGKTVKGRWAIIQWKNGGKTEKRYIFEGFLGDIEEVKVYADQICTGFAFTHRNLYGTDDADLECLTKYLELELISETRFNAIQSIHDNHLTINPSVIVKDNDDDTQNVTLPIKDSLIVYNSKVGYNNSSHGYYGDVDFLNQYLMFHMYPKAEDAFYTFIDRITGKETFMFADYPYISPDKKKIISFVYDVYEEQFYIEVFKINKDQSIVLEHAFNFIHWLATSQNQVKWISNNEFMIEIVNKNIYNGSEVKQPQYLKIKIK